MSRNAFVYKILAELGLDKKTENTDPKILDIEKTLDRYEDEIDKLFAEEPEVLNKYLGNKNV